ncbi:biopolymer transporter ExbD, partial [Sphingobacteriaceae bacterium AH-315-L07]|nr:biopolymer transporter ExbD [Sphingobacteriaceae bacterium AH-315-L07]
SAEISTASLPDIIFMLLFFFMVTTVMKDTTLKVKIRPPEATEVQKLEKKSLVSYIYLGPPMQAIYGTEPRIQLNDAFAEVKDIQPFIISEREKLDEKLIPFMTTSLRVDRKTKMGIVSDIKQQLRKVNALKVNYSTKVGLSKS